MGKSNDCFNFYINFTCIIKTKIRHQNLRLESRIQVGFGDPEELIVLSNVKRSFSGHAKKMLNTRVSCLLILSHYNAMQKHQFTKGN
jgi:hypothetical protein